MSPPSPFACIDDPTVEAGAGAAPRLDGLALLESLGDGLALLDADARINWANAEFRSWAGDRPVLGRTLADVLGCPDSFGPDAEPFAIARDGGVGSARLPCCDQRLLEARVILPPGEPARYFVQFRDATAEERHRQRMAALHHAGGALNNLDADQLSDMSADDRVELLKHNLRQFIHELLHYDTIEIRLLDRATGRLVPLLSDGMTAEAAARELYAEPEGHGVTGYVAATGRGYLCNDTAADPLYIEGAAGAKSSMTVPLLWGDEVIGTFNVESPVAGAFTEQDLQFTETFARAVAQALHTLDLLTAQNRCTATASVEAVSREIAFPADDILAAATALLAHTPPDDAEATKLLRQIVGGVRAIKQGIRAVGRAIAPSGRGPTSVEEVAAEKLHGLRVLVVDGDERSRRSAHVLLNRHGCLVEAARTAREAIALATTGDYDAALIDVRPPDLTGYETYRRLREQLPDARLVMMTSFGYDGTHSIVKARQDGLRHVIYKPFRTDQVIDALVGDLPDAAPVSAE